MSFMYVFLTSGWQEYMKSKAARQEAERKAALESEQAKKMAPLVLRHQQAEAAREVGIHVLLPDLGIVM
jgi:hypothetical protein